MAVGEVINKVWGQYQTIYHKKEDGFLVKLLLINPGATLSLQYHHHRSEHWVLVQGVVDVTIGDETEFLQPDQHAYVPLGELHRIHNPGSIHAVLVEVQKGEFLSEDDIVRLEPSEAGKQVKK